MALVATALVATALVATALVSVGLGAAPARPAALHLHVFLGQLAGAVAPRRGGRGALQGPAAVAALRGQPQVGAPLAVAPHAAELRHGAAPGGPPWRGATEGGPSASQGPVLVFQTGEVVQLGVRVLRHEEAERWRLFGWECGGVGGAGTRLPHRPHFG